MRVKRARTEREPTIALINIVFLMLIFFLVAGTLARPLDKDLKLVRTSDLERESPADALVVTQSGELRFRGAIVRSATAFAGELDAEGRARLRIVPDRELPAHKLVALGRELREAGAEKVVIVTQRALK